MNNERITLTDTTQEIVIKMSDGNPGALKVLTLLLLDEETDPDNAFANIAPILTLDRIGIYGTDIYVLYNDICKGDMTKVIAVLRATQLGLLSSDTLKDASSRQDRSGVAMIDVGETYIKVKEKLPNFDSTNN